MARSPWRYRSRLKVILGNTSSHATSLYGKNPSRTVGVREWARNGGRMDRKQCTPLQWRHNESDGVSNHLCFHCLLNSWFRRRSKKTSKLRVTGLCAGNSSENGEFSAQKASNMENVSNWWRHHASQQFRCVIMVNIPSLKLLSVSQVVNFIAIYLSEQSRSHTPCIPSKLLKDQDIFQMSSDWNLQYIHFKSQAKSCIGKN